AYLHYGKAIRRANLWDEAARVDRKSFPTAGEIYRDQLKLAKEVAAINEFLEKDLRENLY
ncbi:MAG TPA: pyridoxamine 5'-phosphate oxidase family protein, partial [Candidatus Methylomirabilis sp.]|nr:pyridoxamine 5'-phosphate oxidase family protein [Candidatus Methylomirabilis sp.]